MTDRQRSLVFWPALALTLVTFYGGLLSDWSWISWLSLPPFAVATWVVFIEGRTPPRRDRPREGAS